MIPCAVLVINSVYFMFNSLSRRSFAPVVVLALALFFVLPVAAEACGSIPRNCAGVTLTNAHWDGSRYKVTNYNNSAEVRFAKPVFLVSFTAIDWDTKPNQPTQAVLHLANGTTETLSDTSGNPFCDRIDIHLQRIGHGSTLDNCNILPSESGVGHGENGPNLHFRYCCDITSISNHLRRENE